MTDILIDRPGTLIMGILNATPDSFSGDGVVSVDTLVQRGLDMVQAGADILDVGGESSRPFSEPVPVDVEMERVLPVIRRLTRETAAPVSIDTYHPETAEAAIAEGAVMINDISGLENPRMRKTAAESGVYVVIMHMLGTPGDMQANPVYENAVAEVTRALSRRAENALDDGILPSRMILDPGIGFGKRLEHNIQLLRHLDHLGQLGYPLLVGPSRKSFIGEILNLPVDQRLEGTLAAVAASIMHAVKIVRVHDVAPVARFVHVLDTILGHGDFKPEMSLPAENV